MKASEALRKGSTMVEPVMGRIEEGGKCCALGMIGKAATGKSTEWAEPAPWIVSTPTKLPCDCHETRLMGGGGLCVEKSTIESRVCNTIVHLFNYHVMTERDWTVGQIADWLDSVDPSNQVVNNETQKEATNG